MTPETLQLIATIKGAQNPFTLLFLATLVGAIVRVLKTKKVGDVLDALPFAKRIPTPLLPWSAVFLAFVLALVDAKLNGHLAWTPAISSALLSAVLSGGTAIGGHETLAKLVALLLGGGPTTTSSGDPTPAEKKPGGTTRAVLATSFGGLALAMYLSACALFKDPATATNTVLSLTELTCLAIGEAAQVTDVAEAMKLCKIVTSPATQAFVEQFIGQREAGKRAGFVWHADGVVETVAKDAGR